MRVNKFVAKATGLSRRAAEQLIIDGKVVIDGQTASLTSDIGPHATVRLEGRNLQLPTTKTILLNKPAGFVCSRNGQGSPTIYELLPAKLHSLKPVGRLDKDSSGLLVLTNDGDLANQLTHPRYQKTKVYVVQLDKPLQTIDQRAIERGVQLDDGLSRLRLLAQDTTSQRWQVTMQEGRNRQIRRTFAARGYQVRQLERTNFGQFKVGSLKRGDWRLA